MSFSNILLVGAGGFLGSVARYISSITIDHKINSVFPFGTFTVNIAGSFILGFLTAYLAQKNGDQMQWRLFIGTGFCGGFTTFSTFAIENVNLMEQKMIGASLAYMMISLVAGFLAVVAGMAFARSIG